MASRELTMLLPVATVDALVEDMLAAAKSHGFKRDDPAVVAAVARFQSHLDDLAFHIQHPKAGA
jgi:hypothetical protein